MHNAAFAAAGIDGIYLPLAVPPARVAAAVAGLLALGFRGVNVTIPHKQAVIPCLDALSPAAQAIGAVNTIVVQEDGLLRGENTDAPGFLADLVEQGVDVTALQTGGALILGAGGSARAVAYALATAGVPTRIHARRPAAAQALVAGLAAGLAPAQAQHLTASPAIAGEGWRLLVNCTPVGMAPRPDASPWPAELPLQPGQIVYDLVYNPPDTRLLQQARASGAHAINGLGMLLHQGALAWELWTAHPAPIAVMRSVISNQ